MTLRLARLYLRHIQSGQKKESGKESVLILTDPADMPPQLQVTRRAYLLFNYKHATHTRTRTGTSAHFLVIFSLILSFSHSHFSPARRRNSRGLTQEDGRATAEAHQGVRFHTLLVAKSDMRGGGLRRGQCVFVSL